ENTGLFAGVGMPGQGLAIDYQVVVEVREFAINAAGPGSANVELSVKLLDDRTGVVRAQRLFKASVPVSAAASSNVLVAALDDAFSKVQSEIVSWIAVTL
ncbi:MAG: ABC-type transport auxiliary lipoprotein family protein, partial [Martelella sp.]